MKKTAPFPKGILFDMDGVLLITTQSSDQSWHLVCQQFSPMLEIPQQQLEEALRESRSAYRKELQNDARMQRRDRLHPFETRRETVEQALKQFHKKDPLLAEEMVRMYEILRDTHRQLAPHALETLQHFRDHALPLALISNGNATYQRRKIKQHHLAPYFEAILIEEEFGEAKPDQRIFLAALHHLQITSQEAWMIGDNLAFDIAGSQQVGIFAIWNDFMQRGLPERCSIQPDQIIYTLPELFHLLGNSNPS